MWKWLARRFASDKGIQVVLDRRQGERRRRVETVEEERRQEDRRRPISTDLGAVTSFLGEGTRFQGNLSFAGALRVDGRLEGESVRGEVLIIGENGRVDAEIRVEILQVGGHVRGNSSVTRWTELLEPSQVTGTIRTPRLTIWKGAVFNGTCEMPTSRRCEVEATAPPPPSAPDRLSLE